MRLTLLELNEINFEIVKKYLDSGSNLPSFKYLIDKGMLETNSEDIYENIEPWIQWPSVHTGKTFSEHGIFRLGDIVNSKEEQVFEKVEKMGYRVGAISPMNASNKLQGNGYFIPDPWTDTNSDPSFLSKSIAQAISQAVNDNSKSKITLKSLLSLALAFITIINLKDYKDFIKLAFTSFGKPWRKAIFLDKLLHKVHLRYIHKYKIDFSVIFLNAGAHIQHHYFLNSKVFASPNRQNPEWYVAQSLDPLRELLESYDDLIKDYLEMEGEVIIATGLSQKPYERTKFYYRLKDHRKFLKNIGIEFLKVEPRMTRDFLINFSSQSLVEDALNKLESISVEGERLFGEIEIRGLELFVTLTYPNEINKDTIFNLNGNNSKLSKHVVFVAIKNGMHQNKGYAYFSEGLKSLQPTSGGHVKDIHDTIMEYYRN